MLGVVVVALAAAGCGGTSTPPRSEAIHLDGKRAHGDFVFETDASGRRFLVPATILAGQASRAFDVEAPSSATIGEPPSALPTGPGVYKAIVASTTAVVPHSAHIEVLATGESGGRFALSWTDTCGWTQEGKAAVGGTGGRGMLIVRSPAVTLVKVPRIKGGVHSCYLAATAQAPAFTRRLHLAIIDY